MQDYEKELLLLQEYADTHDIKQMNSEDLMKLFEHPHIISHIEKAFRLTNNEFKKVRKEKKISNMYLERCIRNMDSLLSYLDSKYPNVNDDIRNQIISMLRFVLPDRYPNSDFYRNELSKMDFSKEAVKFDIENRDIDVDYRLKELFSLLPHFDKLVESLIEMGREPQEVTIQVDGEDKKYKVIFSDEKYEVKTPTSTRKNSGSKRNQKRENEAKISNGKQGEQIVREAEKDNLKKWGLEHLMNEVKLVAQIDEEYTFDGLGYDLISFNENAEKICIEVKTNKGKRDKPFFISEKEIEVMKGIKGEYDCKHCFIYYVLIDGDVAIIKRINCMDFNTYKLKPVLYKIEET